MSISAAAALTGVVFVVITVVLGAVADDLPKHSGGTIDRVMILLWLAFSIAMILFIVAIWTKALS